MKYKAILFDLDGTLLDYKAAQKDATDNRDDLFNLVNSPEIQNYESRGKPKPDSPEMRQAFKRAGVHKDPVAFLDNYFKNLSKQGILMEGAKDILESLSSKVKLAVVSNGPGSVQKPRLEKAGIAQYFSHFFFSRDIGIAKPDPAILQRAMNELNVKVGETLFIGDSTTSDQPAAQAAGMDFFLFKGDFKNKEILAKLR